MEKQVTLFSLMNFEFSRQKEFLFYTQWDDALSEADFSEPAEKPDFNYSMIIEFEADEAALEEIRMTDTESLKDLLDKSKIIKKQYYI
ncbi:hypothetical protein R1T16_01145 [Flavobacterium sp. DG1-102-2]|uniref:hypothetical protein n=1 Tax=Flavobacterium sp. DG1-102-2 TaxID=3081663 RepID=UPI00294A4BBF|nr:hypothetical protein [Flavobacterium sp. DG1-102-2]MDV6167009.1 hypothetical protein [Flavobacterium sp. DG1-102-2]